MVGKPWICSGQRYARQLEERSQEEHVMSTRTCNWLAKSDSSSVSTFTMRTLYVEACVTHTERSVWRPKVMSMGLVTNNAPIAEVCGHLLELLGQHEARSTPEHSERESRASVRGVAPASVSMRSQRKSVAAACIARTKWRRSR